MLRSFTDRVFGGVCGGLAASLHLNVWLVRTLFAALTLLTLGAFAIVYVLLWWLVPQQSLLAGRRQRGLALPFVIVLAVLVLAAWVGRGSVASPAGVDLFWVGTLVLLSTVFFLRQVRA